MADNLVKLMDETGYRQLINMLISIKSSQQENAEKCISVWQPNTMYQKDKVVLVVNDNTYSEYICKATHVSGETFDETYWTLVSCVEFDGYTEEELLAMLNLSQEELDNLQNLINNSEIQTDHVWSSSKVYAELLTVLSESKNFTIAEVAKIVSFSYKVVTSEDDVIDDKAIYLIENASGTHDMYLLIDGSPSKVGNTSIDLSDYLKKEDIIDTFDGTTIYTDSDKVFSTKATKEALDTKLNKSAIATTLDNAVTDEQVPSALATYNDLLTLKQGINITEITNEYPQNILYFPIGEYYFQGNAVASLFTELPETGKAGTLRVYTISPTRNLIENDYCYRNYEYTTYQGNRYHRTVWTGDTAGVISSDTGWRSIQSFFDDVSQFGLNIGTCTLMDIINTQPNNTILIQKIHSTEAPVIREELPALYGVLHVMNKGSDRIKLFFYPNSDIESGALYMCEYHPNSSLSEWSKVCTTSVPDIPKTKITPINTTYYSISDTNGSWYMVKNGWCIVNLRVTCNTVNMDSNNVFFDSIPKSAGYVDAILFSMSSTYKQPIQINIFENTKLLLRRGEAGIGYIGSFSYPVAEDWRP